MCFPISQTTNIFKKFFSSHAGWESLIIELFPYTHPLFLTKKKVHFFLSFVKEVVYMPTSSKKKVLFGGDSESDEEDYAQMDAEFQPAEPTADKSYDEDEEVGDEDTDRANVQTKSSKPLPVSFQEQKKALRKQLKSRLSAAQLDKIRASFPVDLHQKGGEAPIPHPVAHLPPEGAAWVQKESRRLLVGRFAMTKVEEQRQSEEAERREVEAALLPYYHHLQQQQEDTSSRSRSPSDLPNRTRSSHSPNSLVSSPSKQLIAKSLGLPVGSHFVEKMQEKSREAGWTCAVVQQSPHSSIADACAKHSTMQAYQKMKEQKAMMHASRHQRHLHHTKRSDALSAAAASVVNNSSLTSAVDVDGPPQQMPSEEEVRRGLMLLNDDMLKAEATQMLQEVLQRGGGGGSNSGGSGGSPLGSTNVSPIPSSTTALPPLRESPSPSFRQYGTSPHHNSSSSSALRLVTTQAASHPTVGRRSPDHSIQCGSPVAFSPIRTLSSPLSSSPFETTGKGKPTVHKLAPLDRTTSTLHGGSGLSVSFQSHSPPPPLVQKDVAVIKASLSVLAHPSVVSLSYSLGHTN